MSPLSPTGSRGTGSDPFTDGRRRLWGCAENVLLRGFRELLSKRLVAAMNQEVVYHPTSTVFSRVGRPWMQFEVVEAVRRRAEATNIFRAMWSFSFRWT